MSLESFKISTNSKEEFIDISTSVSEIVDRSNVSEGLCIVYCPHTTAGITINENADPDVVSDLLMSLDDFVKDPGFKHAEGNSISHLKALLSGESVTVPIRDGRLMLGTWQGIYFTEFDGPRNRNVIVKIIK